jgi:DNA-binding PadR family transcriptional regulator
VRTLVAQRRVKFGQSTALLALLSEGPKYGLRLRQEFEAQTGELWPLNVGQVYTTLHRLEREGNVESEGADGTQKRFRITPDGERELDRWLRTPPDVDSPPRDELVIKVQVALRIPSVDVRELLQVHRRQMVQAMQNYTHLKADTPTGDVGLGLLIDAELFRLEGIVRWLDAADARLRHLPDQAWAAAEVDGPHDPAPAGPRARTAGGRR